MLDRNHPDGRFAYVQQFGPIPFSNVGVSTKDRKGLISSFRVGASGKLTSLNPKAADIKVGGADLTIGGNGRFLCTHNTLAGTISGFRIMSDGGLKLVTSARGLPTNSLAGGVGSGLVARGG